MNNFNKLLYTYKSIFNRKTLYDYNKKNAKKFVFQKKIRIFVM